MKHQIRRLPPHQNGKVAGAILAVVSLPIIVIVHLLVASTSPAVGPNAYTLRLPLFMYLLFPPIYFMMGYTAVAFGCLVYNFIRRYTGGFEFDTDEGAEVDRIARETRTRTVEVVTRLVIPITVIGITFFYINQIDTISGRPEPTSPKVVAQVPTSKPVTDCGSINNVPLPCWNDYLSDNGFEGNESLPYYPYAKRPNGCSFPQTTPGSNDLVNVAGFTVSFTDICNAHDRCYYTLGTTPWQCNGPFQDNLRARCLYELAQQPVNAFDVLTLGVSREEAQILCGSETMLIAGSVIGAQNYSHRLAQVRQQDYLDRVDRFVRGFMVPR